MEPNDEELERKRELKRVRNARYRAKQRGEVFDEGSSITSFSTPRPVRTVRPVDTDGHEEAPKGTIKEMLTIMGGGALFVGGLFMVGRMLSR